MNDEKFCHLEFKGHKKGHLYRALGSRDLVTDCDAMMMEAMWIKSLCLWPWTMEDDNNRNDRAAAATMASTEASGSGGEQQGGGGGGSSFQQQQEASVVVEGGAVPMVLDVDEPPNQPQQQVLLPSPNRPSLLRVPPPPPINNDAASVPPAAALTIQVAGSAAVVAPVAPPRFIHGGSPMQLSASASAAVSNNNQASLRMRAHSPVSMASSSSAAAAAAPAAVVARFPVPNNNNNIALLRLEDASTIATNSSLNNNNNINNISNSNSNNNPLYGPEADMEDDETFYNASSLAPSGWSEVEVVSHDNAGGVDGNGLFHHRNQFNNNNTASSSPSARSLHAAALLNGNLLVFGGYDGHQRVNTFHAFNFAEKRWSPVLPAAAPGNNQQQHASPPPTPRDRAIACSWGNAFYVQGGFDGIARVDDFWAFDFSTMMWREIIPLQGRPPSPRHSHAATVHDHSLWIFGGYDGSYKSDLYEFDFLASKWSAIVAAGRRPRARYRATLSVHKNSLILYGGHDGTRHLSDTHVFDIDTRTWSSLAMEGTPPTPRDSHVSVVHGNSVYIFGGSSGAAMNDLHELQLPPNSSMPARWRAVSTGSSSGNNNSNSNNNTAINSSAAGNNNGNHAIVAGGGGADMPRRRFCHVAVVYQDSMYVFGGYDGSERLSDFIKFDFTVYDMSFEVPPSSIIADFKAMINDSTLSDVTFIVEGQEIFAHKLMLIRCSYFQSLFLGSMMESRLSTIRIEQVRHPIFLAVLEYLYTDQLRIPLGFAMELFEAADLFCIPRLKTMCEKRMLQSIGKENAASIFYAADMHSAATLRQKAKKYILTNFEEVSKTTSFEEMGRSNIDLVFELLRSR